MVPIKAPSLRLQQSVHVHFALRGYKYKTVGDARWREFDCQTGTITLRVLIGIVQFSRQIISVVGTENRRAILSKSVALYDPRDPIVLAIRGYGSRWSGIGKVLRRLRHRANR